MLFALAWRNLWRRPQRTVLSLISIAIVSGLLVFMLSFQDGVYATDEGDHPAHLRRLRPAAAGRLRRRSHGGAAIDNPEQIVARPRPSTGSRPRARVNGFAILANGPRSYAAAVVGVDPASEAKISTVAGRIVAGRYLAPADTSAAVIWRRPGQEPRRRAWAAR